MTCQITDCERPSKTRGYCGMHAERIRTHGHPDKVKVVVGDPQRRFWSKVDRRGPAECWPWLGTVNPKDGYGQFSIGTKAYQAHRVAYEFAVGPIPDGLQLDHVRARGCSRRDCVNPAHLEPVTAQVNQLRSDSPSSVNARKSECPQGHPYDLLVPIKGTNRVARGCRTCRTESCRRSRQRRAA